jgi:threonine synthase
MDIQVASNFERALFDALDRDSAKTCELMGQLSGSGTFDIPPAGLERLRDVFSSGSASETDTLETIDRVWRTTGELLCPHSAVGVKVASENLGDEPMITLATASPAKFPETVARATGIHPDLPAHMKELLRRQERTSLVPNDISALKAIVLEMVRQR